LVCGITGAVLGGCIPIFGFAYPPKGCPPEVSWGVIILADDLFNSLLDVEGVTTGKFCEVDISEALVVLVFSDRSIGGGGKVDGGGGRDIASGTPAVCIPYM